MLTSRTSCAAVLVHAGMLSALAMAPSMAMAQAGGHAQRVGQLVEQVRWQRTLALIADGLVADDDRLGALDGPQRACVTRVLNLTLIEMTRERLAERMTSAQVQHWLDFGDTPAGASFMAAFAANAQAQLVSGDDSQAPLPPAAYRAEAETFMASAPFAAFVNALSGQPTFSFKRSQQLHQRFQSDCGVSSPQAT